MYDLYIEKCQSERKQALKEKCYYYHVFCTKFNSHFEVHAKDTCSWCELQLKIVAETNELV